MRRSSALLNHIYGPNDKLPVEWLYSKWMSKFHLSSILLTCWVISSNWKLVLEVFSDILYWITGVVINGNRTCQVIFIFDTLNYKFECWFIQFSKSPLLRESLWCEGRGEKDAYSVIGSLLKCTDQSHFPICLANEIMTYGGNMKSFDEASFLIESDGLEGGVPAYLCVCVDPVANWNSVISAAFLILLKTVC